MRNGIYRSRWIFVVVMFLFLFFHQLMGFLVVPITTILNEVMPLSDRWFDVILPVDVMVAMVFFMVWGFLFDRLSRKRLLSVAGFLWGVAAWLMGISPTFATFNLSKAISGVSQASFSGIYAMVGDLFKPTNRGKVFSLLLMTQPLAIVLSAFLQFFIEPVFGWRLLLILFGAIGFLITLAIHLLIVDPKRGEKEPALMDINIKGMYLSDWDIAKLLLIKPSLILIYALIFLGTIPVVILFNGLNIFLQDVYAMQTIEIYVNLFPAMVGVVLGYPVGGILGDILFRKTKSGRLIPCIVSLLLPIIFLYAALSDLTLPADHFAVLILLVSFFMAMSLPNLFTSIMDVTFPELRASASALILFFQTLSIIITPYIFSIGQGYLPIGKLILGICIGAWLISLVLLGGLLLKLPKDIEELRRHMAYRSLLETRLEQLEG